MAEERTFSRGATPTDLRDAVDAAIHDGDVPRARLTLQHLWAQHAGPAQAGFVSGRWARCEAVAARARPLRVALLRSFTLEPAVPLLRAGGLVNGLDIDVTIGDFNSYGRELLDPASALYGPSAPDVVILAVHTRDIAPELWAGTGVGSEERRAVATRVVAEVSGLISAFRERSRLPMIVHGLEIPTDMALGIADAREPLGQRGAIELVNEGISNAADSNPDVHFLNWNAVAASVGRRETSDERKWVSMRMPLGPAGLTAMSRAWLGFLHPISTRVAKCIVVDLDNTMWGGVLGEDGIEGVSMGPDGVGAPFLSLQRALLVLRDRGILLAICSKNNESDAIAAIDNHPDMLLRSTDFHSKRINWSDKAANVREIASELGIGIDSLAFLDDNPAERLLIATELPDVTVLPVSDDPSSLATAVRSCPLFERLELTTEDRRRSTYYEQQSQRAQSRTSAGSLEDYLRSLGTCVEVRTAEQRDMARVAQLTQKTNQFNLTTRRYSEQQVADLAIDPGWDIFVVTAFDRFGEHGLIATALVERTTDRWRLDTLLMSCRVIGRDIESALMCAILERARTFGALELVGEYVPTSKNEPASDFYARHGFTEVESSLEGECWTVRVSAAAIDVPDWVTVTHDARVSQGAS